VENLEEVKMKVVINKCYGGFGLSDKALMKYAEIKGIKLYKGKSEHWGTPFYTVPETEFKKIHKEDEKIGDYTKSNAVCFSRYNITREDPVLVQVVEELGDKVNTQYSKLEVVEIPDGIKYEIDDYDGIETIHEEHRSW
jgi:hypothetical protein